MKEGGRARKKEDGPARAESRQAKGCPRVSRGAPGPAKNNHKYFPQPEGTRPLKLGELELTFVERQRRNDRRQFHGFCHPPQVHDKKTECQRSLVEKSNSDTSRGGGERAHKTLSNVVFPQSR